VAETPQKILVAVAWPYANGPRHIGHVAGFGVPADIFARYHRLKGNDVLMVSGTDEHGTPIMLAADAEGVSPREIADRYSAVTRDDLRRLGLSYDLFTRTTTRNHHRVVQDVFRTLFERGYLLEEVTRGAFSASTGQTLPDRYIEGTCPICGFPEARGDQCDNCGNMLDPIDLIEPRSRIDGLPPEFRDTKHLFLDLPAFKERLTEWISQQRHWRANVRNFSLKYIEDLRPRAVTRDLDWGIPVPVDGYPPEEKRIYVWIDAVVGYFSAAVEWAANRGTPDAWREWWQNPDARHFYFMGKDNIVFHSVIWPAELLGYDGAGEYADGRDLELPYNIVSSEFLTYEGRQFSTSRRHVIYVGEFLDRYDADSLRYYLTAAGPETQDADFSWGEFVRRNNDELLANWGNLVNRTLVNVRRHFEAVPEPGELEDSDRQLLAEIAKGFESVGALIEAARFRAALAEAMRLSALANAYVAEQAPWALVESDRQRAATILYTALRAVGDLKTLFAPFLPFSSQRVHELLGGEGWIAGPLEIRTVEEDDGSTHDVLSGDYGTWIGAWQPGELPAGRSLPEPEPLFRKLDAEAVIASELT
jgi:methionyl-tRNA synthetase